MSRAVLLDTNIVIWILSEQHSLSRAATARLNRNTGDIFVSIVSLWEILLKHQTGKLRAGSEISSVLRAIRDELAWKIMPLRFEHLVQQAALPPAEHHKDPFDRLLIAQALYEKLDIITADAEFARYGVRVVW